MKRLLTWSGLIVIALLICVWRLPASVVVALLPAEAVRIVQLYRASGTLWNGSAQLNVLGVPPTLAVTWRCHLTLLPLGARCDLSDAINGSINVGALSLTLTGEQLTASVPLEVTPVAGVTGSSARVAAIVNSVSLSATALSLKATLRADDARYRLGQSEVLLGEITADCAPSADGAASTCSIANRGGNAKLDGRITLTPSKASGSMDLTPTNGAAQRVTF